MIQSRTPTPFTQKLRKNGTISFFVLPCLLTLLALVLNVLSAMGTVTMGNVLFAVLIVVSSPMVCSGYWALSLFLWACLLIVSHSLLRKNFN